jgi:hypothetical protein
MMAKRKINAKEAVIDIRAGMDDLALMEKYTITDKGLESLFNKLISSGLVTREEIEDRDSPFLSTVTLELD